MFADALRKAGAQCNHVFVVFYYDIFAHAREEMKEAGLELHYLASWWDVLEQIKNSDKFDDKTCAAVEAFLHDPKGWSAANGGTTTKD
jgi:orotate phosphoribosyltransferase